MTNEEAIKYLKQLYPNGGHCWLDEQRIEAIDMAVKALKEEPVSEDMEDASRNYADNEEYGDDVYFAIKAAFKAGAKWQKEQLMAKAVDGTAMPNDAELWLESQNDLKEFAEGEEVKVIVIKKDEL